ncbi:MAG: hypothetical protein II547_09200 [Treponema sp.]|nr:hypothetical protein [Treponema sp.]MBQ5385091.1 hypothetical protein [Treponema sp.]
MEKYEDIINMEWPIESERTRMSLDQRAKIFLPFAALKGYEESLENELKTVIDGFNHKNENPDDFFDE